MDKPYRRLLAGTLGLAAALISGVVVARASGVDRVVPIPVERIRGLETRQPVGKAAAAPVLSATELRAAQADFAAGSTVVK